MPSYETVLLIRKLDRPTLKTVLKRCAAYVFENDGTLRKMENLGLRNTPYRINAHNMSHDFAHYFIFSYDLGVKQSKLLKEKLKLDLDIVRAMSWVRADNPLDLHVEKKEPECTLYLDLQPAPLRAPVKTLQEIAKRKNRKKGCRVNFDDPEFLIY